MKTIKLAVLGLLIATTYQCKEAKKEADKASDTVEAAAEDVKDTAKEMLAQSVSFQMSPKNDSNVSGSVTFTEMSNKVMMKAVLTGLTPGEHAIHIHDKADCSSADGKSTGGHWNPTSTPHGKWGAKEGHHKGDIGNFIADDQGNATIDFETNQWCIGCDDTTKNIIGKGVIVHQGVDDYTSQPSGAAGSRISCAGIIQ